MTKSFEGNSSLVNIDDYFTLIDIATEFNPKHPKVFIDENVKKGKIKFDANGNAISVELYNCDLNGPIPPLFGSLSHLKVIDLR